MFLIVIIIENFSLSKINYCCLMLHKVFFVLIRKLWNLKVFWYLRLIGEARMNNAHWLWGVMWLYSWVGRGGVVSWPVLRLTCFGVTWQALLVFYTYHYWIYMVPYWRVCPCSYKEDNWYSSILHGFPAAIKGSHSYIDF